MKIIASGAGSCHAPAHTLPALFSAFVSGADGIYLPLQLTADGKTVIFADATTGRFTSQDLPIAGTTLKALRALNIGEKFTDATGASFAYKARIESLGLLMDELPSEAWLVLELKPEPDAPRRQELIAQAAAGIVHRGRQAQTLFLADTADSLAAFRKLCPGAFTALHAQLMPALSAIAAAEQGTTGGVVVTAEDLVDATGKRTPAFDALHAAHMAGRLPLGALVLLPGTFNANLAAQLQAEPLAWGIMADSQLQAALTLRAGWHWIDEHWTQKAAQGQDVNTDLWHLGYAKYNPQRYCHVFADDGIHVKIAPFTGETSFPVPATPEEEQLQKLLSRSWEANKDWPFYSGGGVGFVPGIEGDFSAEIDMRSATAQQATTMEMAVVNVDPGPHRAPWQKDAAGAWKPNFPASFRDKHTFYDPHGCPPYVGAEHDEDDGWRINWNLGSDYDSNQYGRAVGDGKLLSGRMRLDRRGAYFAAYYRATDQSGAEDWICVGVVRNESLNRKVYLRVVGKRWRQEDPAQPSVYLPVIPNHFTFQKFTLTRFQ